MIRNIAKYAVMTVLSAFLISTAIYAEEEEGGFRKAKGAGAGGFMFGVNRMDLEELNTKLEDRGFESLADNTIFFGGGGYGVVRGKVILGGTGGGFTQDVSSDSMKATVGGGYGFFNVGYVVYSKGGLRVFPLFGIGGGGINLKIVGEGDTPSFDDLLENPGREVNVFAGSLLFDVAVGADYLLYLGEDEKGKGGLIFGVRAGYTFSPTKPDWRMEDMDVLRGPDVGITGPYVHLVFGGGGSEK